MEEKCRELGRGPEVDEVPADLGAEAAYCVVCDRFGEQPATSTLAGICWECLRSVCLSHGH